MACFLMAPRHYLNQCWLIISGVLWHSPESTNMCSKITPWKFLPHPSGFNELTGVPTAKLCITLEYKYNIWPPVWFWLHAIQNINSLWPHDAVWQHRSGSKLAQVMAWCLIAPSHYLNQCWLIISKVLWQSPESNFTGNVQDIYPWYKFEITNFILQPHLPGVDELTLWSLNKVAAIWETVHSVKIL